MGTGDNASEKRRSANREMSQKSNDEYIKQLHDEIDRLKAECARGSQYQMRGE